MKKKPIEGGRVARGGIYSRGVTLFLLFLPGRMRHRPNSITFRVDVRCSYFNSICIAISIYII